MKTYPDQGISLPTIHLNILLLWERQYILYFDTFVSCDAIPWIKLPMYISLVDETPSDVPVSCSISRIILFLHLWTRQCGQTDFP